MSTLIAVMRGLLPLTMLATLGLVLPSAAEAQTTRAYQCIMPLPVEHPAENTPPAPVQRRNICRLPARRQPCVPPVNQVEASQVPISQLQDSSVIASNIDESIVLSLCNNITSNPMIQEVNTLQVIQEVNTLQVIQQTDDIRQMINVVDISQGLCNRINIINDEPIVVDEEIFEPNVVEQPLPENLLARRTASDDAATASMRLTNYPNPFTARTTIDYTLAREGHTSLMIYDATGNLVTTLVDGRLGAGSYSAVWTPEDLPSGTYICRLQCDGSISTRTVVLNR